MGFVWLSKANEARRGRARNSPSWSQGQGGARLFRGEGLSYGVRSCSSSGLRMR
jgi:hypothetical protein